MLHAIDRADLEASRRVRDGRRKAVYANLHLSFRLNKNLEASKPNPNEDRTVHRQGIELSRQL
jgi:hypothetical protein